MATHVFVYHFFVLSHIIFIHKDYKLNQVIIKYPGLGLLYTKNVHFHTKTHKKNFGQISKKVLNFYGFCTQKKCHCTQKKCYCTQKNVLNTQKV